MANILSKYGIKEVADVTFYSIDSSTGSRGVPVLYLDTLKVSTIEQTAEEATANGGKGNPPLITWDYGKEITVTLEDALFSAKSMAIMFGNGSFNASATTDPIYKTVQWVAKTDVTSIPTTGTGVDTSTLSALESSGLPKVAGKNGERSTVPTGGFVYKGDSNDKTAAASAITATVTQSECYFYTYAVTTVNNSVQVIDISANTFPGTYYVTGDTFARRETDGIDEYFQFIIPKAKVTSENTITLEAEGDPSVFNMNLKVLRPADGGPMMKLVKYDMN